MRIDRGMVISLIGHGAFLVWALVSFARPLETKPFEAVEADVISADDFNKIAAGSSSAPKAEAPKPVVEKIAEPKPAEDLNAKVTEKKEVQATTSESAPEPAPKQAEPKPAAAPPEPKQEAKAPEKKEPEQQKIDPIAEALKKDDTKKPDKKVENKPQPVKKPEPQQPKFDPRKVAALLDKRDPQRMAAAGTTMNSIASHGMPRGDAPTLSASELSALAARLRQNWVTPPGVPDTLRIRIYISLKRDGTLAAPPQVATDGAGGIYQAMRESALRAIMASQPFDMLRPSNYEGWKELDLRFTTADLS
jgi:colicin import membrane protein